MQPASISRPLKYISLIFSTIIGVTFIVSGFLKAVDPWGTAIKFEEYFAIYGFHSLMDLADALAIWLCGAEMMMGCMMLFKVRLRLISIFALLSMSAFTIISLLSVTLFPVDDCGCFGDAIALTPLQTLYKNLVILPMVITVWYRYRPDRIFAFNIREAILTLVFCVSAMGFSLYNYIHLPMIDFLPYKVGVNMLAEHETPKQMEFVLVYRNIASGELREFSIQDTEWRNEQQWEWVETRPVTPEKQGNNLAISDFVLRNEAGDDFTERILSEEGITNMVCITKFDRVRKPCLERISAYANERIRRGERVIVITPSKFEKPYSDFPSGDRVPIFNIDDVTLKALLRANNGAVEFEGGVIKAKHSCADL